MNDFSCLKNFNLYNLEWLYMKRIKNLIESTKEKTNSWLYDHLPLKHGIDFTWALIISTVSAFVFAFGFNCFVSLQTLKDGIYETDKFVAGGVSGISQTFTLFLEICGLRFTSSQEHLLFSILYFVINVPVIIVSFFGIGKRYTLLTLINVLETSLFTELLSPQNVQVIYEIGQYVNTHGGLLARVIFGGVTTGLSAAIAFKGDLSTGGIDVIAYFIALKKRTSVGKYSVIMNACTLTIFTILSCTQDGWGAVSLVGEHAARAVFSTVYLFVAGLVVDKIHTRNKKVKLEIVTDQEDMGTFIISHLPHAATMIKGKGVYTDKDKYIFDIVISTYELNEAVKLIKKEDPNAFIEVIPLTQVEGRFYMRPIK